MSTKRLPIVGQDQNQWGQLLNDNISQLSNPTTGGINTFDTFSQRPTNLTPDDQGKTYLYTQTGNIHQWDGANWVVQNKSVINARDYGELNSDAIQKAIDVTDSLGGFFKASTVFLEAGDWSIDNPIKLKKGIRIVGSGRATILVPHPVLGDNHMFYTPENSGAFEEIHIENFSVQDQQPNPRTKYHFHLCNTVNLRISKIWFVMENRGLSDVGGFNIYTDNTVQSYLPRITDCLIANASIVMAITDSWIMRNSIFGHTRSFAIQMKTSSSQIEHNEMLGSPVNGCVYIDAGIGANVGGILMRNNYFDGGYSDTNGGSAIKCVSNLNQSIISSNWIYNNNDEGIILNDPTDVVINGNVFDSSNRRDVGKHEIVINGSRGPQNLLITSNTFSRTRNPQTNKGYVIYAPGPFSDAKQNIISHNVVNASNYLPNGLNIANNIQFTLLQNKGIPSLIPEFSDNTSALAGGLLPGDFYRTGDLLKVVH